MIRRATADDIPVIRAMADVVFRRTYREILSPEQMDYMMEWMYSAESLRRQMLEEGNVFFLEEGKGYASVRRDGFAPDGRERFHLEKLFVMPDCQGSGLGRRFFDTVADYVRSVSPGHPRLELNVNRNNPAVRFYEHIGMYPDRAGEFPIGKGFYMNDFIMAIDL